VRNASGEPGGDYTSNRNGAGIPGTDHWHSNARSLTFRHILALTSWMNTPHFV
jgi:hypothetical protein